MHNPRTKESCLGTPSVATSSGVGLFRFASELLAIPFASERLLGPSLVAGFQVEGMLLDILDDVFLLNLPLEPAESALDRFALLDFDFSHASNTPFAGGKMTNSYLDS